MLLFVVMNGLVVKAGSMPNLSSKSGMEVPINEAMIITETKAMVTMIPILVSTPSKKWLPKNKTVAKINPLSKLREISLSKRLTIVPLIV